MCLSIPSKVLSIDENNFAIVETLGVKRGVSLDLIGEPVAVGEYILIHVGFAMSKIDTEQALASLELYQKIADDMSSGEIYDSEGDLGLKAMNGDLK
ncbi:MAG: HypC/HybG/HupF family hydrogenase formation chaperone [Campylobacter sp.]|nr:HypC/HybG/HupF family hydrogenase formation chaperone [Campylobacter sp.]